MKQPLLLLKPTEAQLIYNANLYKEWGPQQLKIGNSHILFILNYEAESVRSPVVCRVVVTQRVHKEDSKPSVVHMLGMEKAWSC